MVMEMPKIPPTPHKQLDEILPQVGENYARWLLNSRRRQITTQLKVKVQQHLSILAYEGFRRLGKVLYKNDVIELLTAWVFSDPERLKSFLDWAFDGDEWG